MAHAKRITYFPAGADTAEQDTPARAARRLNWFNDVARFINGESLTKPVPQTLGASPYVYEYRGTNGADLVVTGGTVTAIELSRDLGTTWLNLGITQGIFTVSPHDWVRFTYAVLPTLTLVQR